VRQDDSAERSRRRADLQAQLRVLEEKRDRLQEQIAARRFEPVHRAEEPAPEVIQAAISDTLEKTLKAVRPILAMLTSARDDLLAERAEAVRGNDAGGATEATQLLDYISALLDELTDAVARMNTLAETVRTSMASGAPNASKESEAG